MSAIHDLRAIFEKTLEYDIEMFQDMQVTPGNVHDMNFLKDAHLEDYIKGKTLLGDRGSISRAVQTDLFTTYDIKLEVPYRSNQKEQTFIDKVK